tara:strand:+ start:942 stop:1376 length:435 start_codon:yes stop_codon:yes gene_type:complete
MTNNSVRKAEKKLRIFKENNPGIIDERHEELRRGVVVAKLTEAKKQQRDVKKLESLKKNNMSSDEVLDIHFKENAEKNAEKEKLALIKDEQDKISAVQKEKDNKEYKEFYDNILQPAIAKHIILSIVEHSEKQKFEKSKSKKSK